NARHGRQRARARCKMQKLSAGKFHGDVMAMPLDDTKTIPIAVRVKGDAISADGPTEKSRDVRVRSEMRGIADIGLPSIIFHYRDLFFLPCRFFPSVWVGTPEPGGMCH